MGGIASLIAIWGVISQRALARRRATIDHISGLINDHDYIKARQKFVDIANSETGLLPYAELENDDADNNAAVQLILNNYELMAIGIQRGILDFKVMKRYARGTILKHWDVAAPFIIRLRIVANNQRVYQQFETLKNWMSDEKQDKPKGRFWSLIF